MHQKTFVHRRLYTQRFLRKEGNIYTQLLLCAFARINVTQAFLHTEPFPQRNLCTEQFLHMFFLHKKHLTQKNLYTQTAHRNFYRSIFLHAETLYTQGNFLHIRNFFAQMPFRTNKLYTAVFTDRRFLHRTFSAQKSYAQNIFYLYIEIYIYIYTHIYTRICTYAWTDG